MQAALNVNPLGLIFSVGMLGANLIVSPPNCSHYILFGRFRQEFWRNLQNPTFDEGFDFFRVFY